MEAWFYGAWRRRAGPPPSVTPPTGCGGEATSPLVSFSGDSSRCSLGWCGKEPSQATPVWGQCGDMGVQERQRHSRSLWHAHRLNNHCPERLPLGLSGSAQPCLCWYVGAPTAAPVAPSIARLSGSSSVPLGWACWHSVPIAVACSWTIGVPGPAGPRCEEHCAAGVLLVPGWWGRLGKGCPWQQEAQTRWLRRTPLSPGTLGQSGGCRGNLLPYVQGASARN